MKKKVLSLFLVAIMLFETCGMVFATEGYPTITPVIGETGPLGDIANNVIGAIQVIGYIVAVIMVAYAGIKYLTAGAGTKASVKGDLVPMLVGAILVVGAVTIVGWVWGIAA